MAHHKSAQKRIRTSEAAKLYNRGFRKQYRTSLKSLLEAKDQKSAEEHLKKAVSVLDKMASKHIIHKNKAANQKAKLMNIYNSLS